MYLFRHTLLYINLNIMKSTLVVSCGDYMMQRPQISKVAANNQLIISFIFIDLFDLTYVFFETVDY